jgi:pteridine reductase
MPDRPLALITGAARRVGAAFARHLAGRGWDLLLHARSSRAEAEALRDDLRAMGAQAELHLADLARPAERDELAAAALETSRERGLGLLIHNASAFPHRRLDQTDDALVDELFALHVKAPLLLSRDLAPALARGQGLVLTMLDAGAQLHWPGYLAYALSKQALREATIALARELAPAVRVCGLAPGFTLPPEDAPEAYRRAEERRLTQAQGAPAELLKALDYLLGAPFVTGEVLTVDGGRRWLRP